MLFRSLADIGWTVPEPAPLQPIVAVLDTGVVPVPDLAEHVMKPEARSFVAGRSPLVDTEGHGTHVAGIIAAVTGNGIGISGIADARILPVTVADASGGATTASLIQGLHYAVGRGARIVNISFAGTGYSALEQQAIDEATAAGVLVVAASGNSGATIGRVEYPAAYRHVLAVGATGPGQIPLALSTQGPQVSVAAPGSEIISTNAGGDGSAAYVPRTGTSVAAPMVSGIAARLLARRPDFDPSQLRAIIQATAIDVSPAGVEDRKSVV